MRSRWGGSEKGSTGVPPSRVGASLSGGLRGGRVRAERFCRERGSTVLKAPSEMFGRFASTLPLNKRARAASALRHYFAVLGRSEPDVPALRAAGSQPGGSREETEGHRLGAPHRGRGWERTESLAAIRVRRAREHMLRAGMSEATIRHYSSMLWQAERWCELRGFALVELDARTLAEYSEALSGASRRSLRSALRPYYAALEVDDPPIGAVRPPRKPRLIPKPLELFEAQQLLAAAVIDEDTAASPCSSECCSAFGASRSRVCASLTSRTVGCVLLARGNSRLLSRCRALDECGRRFAARVALPFPWPGRPRPYHPGERLVHGPFALAPSRPRQREHAPSPPYLSDGGNDVTHDLRAVQEFPRHSDPDTPPGIRASRARGSRRLVTPCSKR